ncbi:30S ribosome-binding factor RbfA [Rhabdothermincola salaria]|uniref:30S ribosome-binding factor RbfA n=1 Tax=Rhabdothermincola salaria TaxID=2903142 RepID=UPI001E5077CE|nr:30S ribosome-binding factor RbfA [Rhabdothermincola salaria]MCD9624916.1 30S ribosome-binding factor RbfA [Rhabdothermincola salaria]
MSPRPNRGGPRQYPRTARLNELLREILADELEKIDDERLDLLSITAVDIDGDLRQAMVFFDSLQGEEGDEEILEALGEVKWRLKGAIARQARIKRTPELTFAPDAAVRSGARIEELLAEVGPIAADDASADDGAPAGDTSGPGTPAGDTSGPGTPADEAGPGTPS